MTIKRGKAENGKCSGFKLAHKFWTEKKVQKSLFHHSNLIYNSPAAHSEGKLKRKKSNFPSNFSEAASDRHLASRCYKFVRLVLTSGRMDTWSMRLKRKFLLPLGLALPENINTQVRKCTETENSRAVAPPFPHSRKTHLRPLWDPFRHKIMILDQNSKRKKEFIAHRAIDVLILFSFNTKLKPTHWSLTIGPVSPIGPSSPLSPFGPEEPGGPCKPIYSKFIAGLWCRRNK